jgi:hypothetical protein
MSRVKIKIVSSSEAYLIKEEMWRIYRKFYQCAETHFSGRFSEITNYALYSYKGSLVGFTGIISDQHTIDNMKVHLFCFGCTAVLPEYRGLALLQKTSLIIFIGNFLRNPFRPIFFWCHASTYKSYLGFAGLPMHYPSRHRPTPTKYRHFIDRIGAKYFGQHYDEKTGNAFFEGVAVKEGKVNTNSTELLHPAVQFYQKIKRPDPENRPGVYGVISVAPLNLKNLLALIAKKPSRTRNGPETT